VSKIRRVDFSPDEWLSGTSELEVDEKGAYWTVCALIYSRGEPIADDERWIAKACGCHWRQWRRIRERLLALGKIRLTDDGRLTNGRAERELARAFGRVEDARAAAEESARIRAERRAAREAENGSEPAQDGRRTVAGTSQDARTTPAQPPQETAKTAKINDLAAADASGSAQANHQPSTINHQREEKSGESLTETPMRADGAPAEKRATRLPDGWRPEGELREWTIEEIRKADSSVSAGHELEKFTDYWKAQPGAKGRKLDWPATWRNWIREAIRREGRKPNGTQRSGQSNGARNFETRVIAATAFSRVVNKRPAAGGSGDGREAPADASDMATPLDDAGKGNAE
jgi:uncharacterized protein YdaU (DUF1376 family)